jgi:O-antigen/teichoic acid export membrane protein
LKETESLVPEYSGKLLTQNTIYNLIGYGIPLLFALFIIPVLLRELGEEKFGLLTLVWVVIGYFSFFDFGVGKALTKIIAEQIGVNQPSDIPGTFWASFFLMLVFSSFGSLLILFISPLLVASVLKISEGLQPETIITFYILALSIPLITTTAGMRGFLEAYQKFSTINIIRTFLGVFSFLGPLICLLLSDSLIWIAFSLVVIRLFVWLIYLFQCIKINSNLKKYISFQRNFLKPILRLSGWITISNLIVPILIYLDRFLIGAIISASAIAYYTTPYEIVSKLLLIPGALTGVLFPAFSANYSTNPEFTQKISLKAIKYIVLIMYPLVLVIMVFAFEGLSLWLGEKFANNSYFILQIMALGIFVNSVAYIPFSFLQGIGKPEITAKIQLFELPLFAIAMWFAVSETGIKGAVLVWFVRIVIDAILLFAFTKKNFSFNFSLKIKNPQFFLSLIFIGTLVLTFFTVNIYSKSLLLFISLSLFSFVSWKLLLTIEERAFIILRLKSLKK